MITCLSYCVKTLNLALILEDSSPPPLTAVWAPVYVPGSEASFSFPFSLGFIPLSFHGFGHKNGVTAPFFPPPFSAFLPSDDWFL